MRKRGIYMWVDDDLFEWCKSQSNKLKKELHNENFGTKSVSKVLLDKVLIPNNVDLTNVVKPKIPLNLNANIKKRKGVKIR